MQTITTINALRAYIRQWRQAGQSIAFVPTMGNLHAGHIQLLTTGKQKADKVAVSIFVNPTQFGKNEDFDHYPRTEKQDLCSLQEHGADLVFLPSVDEIYPQIPQTSISIQPLSKLHCGTSRPGHFDGVALIVCKLLNLVQPDLLLLGKKDIQQLILIKRMIADLNIPVEIQGVSTLREPDGLAMSSRNGYLSENERLKAPFVYKCLCNVRDEILSGNRDYGIIIANQINILESNDFIIDYFKVCRNSDLLEVTQDDTDLVIIIAAKLGKTRLIDNISFQLKTIA